MLRTVAGAPHSFRHIMVIAHNPGTHMLALELADPVRSNEQALSRLQEKFPTAGLAHYTFDIRDWSEILEETGSLEVFATPKGAAREQASLA